MNGVKGTAKKPSSLIKLTWPIFVDLLLVFSVTAVDAWFLSQISDTAAAAVGAVLPLVGLGFTFFITLSYAGTSIASQQIGAGKTESLPFTYGMLLQIFLIAGLLVGGIFHFFSQPLCQVLGMSQELVTIAASYLSALGSGVVFLALKYATNAILSSQQRTSINMLSSGLMAGANLVLNYALVHGVWGFPAMGATGVALASCLAWLLSLMFSLWVIYFGLKIPIFIPRSMRALKLYATPVLKIAGPSVLEPLSWHLSQVAIVAVIVQLGQEVLATRVYANNILFLVAMFGTAMSAGVQIKVSHNIGARDFAGANRELFLGLKIGLCGAVVLVSALYLFSDRVFAIFTDNPAIMQLGKQIILVALVCEIGRMLNLVVGASLKASGDAKYISFWGIVIMWLVSVPLAWLLGYYLAFGLVGVWLALAVDELVRGSVALTRWNSCRWQSKGVYASGVQS